MVFANTRWFLSFIKKKKTQTDVRVFRDFISFRVCGISYSGHSRTRVSEISPTLTEDDRRDEYVYATYHMTVRWKHDNRKETKSNGIYFFFFFQEVLRPSIWRCKHFRGRTVFRYTSEPETVEDFFFLRIHEFWIWNQCQIIIYFIIKRFSFSFREQSRNVKLC